ncbi:hypothetical protein CQA49_09570 [Helicobacter sp. MIT 00-7814]|uniref:lipase family protein n=1 Tax=unclassified Helicobacter TaxID=2593540 RepID=UPI000E1ECFFB|nr:MULTISPECIES: hypothetical protein [unclassified Helicobacter]RDU51466.1 hypothetical protein CQA49_09570 [Helicobacter sp. MIT 00-7814]RDU52000.1 hypothetical protein CQA37_09065 [Helicobacter sp. MIT 99-10781]
MANKEQIKKIKNNAELAWAAYGYFHLANKNYKPEKGSEDKKRIDTFTDIRKKELKAANIKHDDTDEIYPAPTDILNIDYKYYRDEKGNPIKSFLGFEFLVDKFLGGDFTPNQAKQFFEKYDLLIHQPNTESGFSACLFQNKETKEFTLALRGTEFRLNKDLINDYYIGTNNNDTKRIVEQYIDMLIFYEEQVRPLLERQKINQINVTGHSLGGFLTQLLALVIVYCVNVIIFRFYSLDFLYAFLWLTKGKSPDEMLQ